MRAAENWTITVWGTRGAIPAAKADFLEYGGNTSCISVRCGSELVVFDAGSGIVHLDAGQLEGTDKRVHLFFSHMHLDHIQGLVGFPLLHDPSAELHLYGEARGGMSFRAQLERLIGPPYWPLGLKDFRAGLTVHEIRAGETIPLAEGLRVHTLRGCHPNMSVMYRLEGQDRSIVYALDCELTKSLTPRLADFARDCGLLVWDANFAGADLQKGWGHSTWEQGVAMQRSANARTVLMTHYDRSYTDAFLREQERLARQENAACVFAREGMVIDL